MNIATQRVDSMIEGIVWHGVGTLCILSIVFLVRQIARIVHGQTRKIRAWSIGIGIVSGISGFIVGILMLTILDRITRIDPYDSMLAIIRMIVFVPIVYFGVFLVSFVSGSVLKKICHKRIVMDVAFIVTAILVAQPVVHGWIKFLFR